MGAAQQRRGDVRIQRQFDAEIRATLLSQGRPLRSPATYGEWLPMRLSVGEIVSGGTILHAFTPRVLFRLHPGDLAHAYAVSRPEAGWSSWAEGWTWADLLILQGWCFDGEHHDVHGDGFWMAATRHNGGVYGRSEARP